jgi:RNA polymerase sigma-70 factor (ECF subfamily)
MSIANNEAVMFHRREQRRRKRETPCESDTVACRSEPADRALIRVEVNRAIHLAILSLPTRYREVVIRRDVEELSLEETAKRLKATLSGVKTRLFRGRRKIAAVLRSREATVFHAAA